MAHKIDQIKGMDAALKDKLEGAGIKTTEQLLDVTGTSQQRTNLAHKLGITPAQLGELTNRADLMRLKGVGTEMANLLEEVGVDTVKELRHRNADALQAKLKETNDAKHITHHAPTLAQVREWITESQQLPAHGQAPA